MEQKVDTNDARNTLLTAPLGKLLVTYASPAVASMLFMAFYQITDAIMVGRSLGPEAIASVTILYPIVALLSGLAVMLGVGGNARIAVLMGEGEVLQARRVLGLIVTFGLILGLGGSILTLVLMPQLLSLLGTSGLLGVFAGEYLKAILPFFTPLILIFILEQAVRNDGSPHFAGIVMALCALLNIGLDYVFLFVLRTGIAGAAIASGLSQSLGALVFIIYFLRKIGKNAPGIRFSRPDFRLRTIQKVCVNGFSEMFNSLSMGITTFLFNRLILSFVGPIGVAALTVVQYPIMLGLMIIMGIGNGAQPIISYNHGAQKGFRVKKALLYCSVISTTIGVFFFFLIFFRGGAVAKVFLPDHPEAVLLTTNVGKIVSFSMLFMPLGMIISTYFTSLEQAGKSLVIAVCRSLILPLFGLVIFPLFLEATGIWITPLFTEFVGLVLASAILIRFHRTFRYPSVEESTCEAKSNSLKATDF